VCVCVCARERAREREREREGGGAAWRGAQSVLGPGVPPWACYFPFLAQLRRLREGLKSWAWDIFQFQIPLGIVGQASKMVGE
jgi:hypothetical protein